MLIFGCDLIVKQFNLVLMLLQNLLLLLYSSRLVNDVAFKTLHVGSDILHLALNELQLSFGFEGHVLDLVFIFFVFLLDLAYFLVTILLYTLNCSFVAPD